MATTSAILLFLDTFGIIVEENETSEYVDLMMDNHKCVEFAEVQYYVPENAIGYSESDLDIYEVLIDNYLV